MLAQAQAQRLVPVPVPVLKFVLRLQTNGWFGMQFSLFSRLGAGAGADDDEYRNGSRLGAWTFGIDLLFCWILSLVPSVPLRCLSFIWCLFSLEMLNMKQDKVSSRLHRIVALLHRRINHPFASICFSLCLIVAIHCLSDLMEWSGYFYFISLRLLLFYFNYSSIHPIAIYSRPYHLYKTVYDNILNILLVRAGHCLERRNDLLILWALLLPRLSVRCLSR